MTLSDTGYISLKEATKYCRYSQDYLKLRSRQKKLKAVKIGRNWATKREWLEEYLNNIENINNIDNINRGIDWQRVLEFKLIIFIISLGLITFLFSLFVGPEYFQWVGSQTQNFLASFGNLIPSRVIEIK